MIFPGQWSHGASGATGSQWIDWSHSWLYLEPVGQAVSESGRRESWELQQTVWTWLTFLHFISLSYHDDDDDDDDDVHNSHQSTLHSHQCCHALPLQRLRKSVKRVAESTKTTLRNFRTPPPPSPLPTHPPEWCLTGCALWTGTVSW